MRQLLLAVIPSAARDLAGLLPKEILRCARDDSHISCLFLPDPALAPLAVRSLNGVRSHGRANGRSEEHTYERQPLMRSPYAVVCLKKNTSAPHSGRAEDDWRNTCTDCESK